MISDDGSHDDGRRRFPRINIDGSLRVLDLTIQAAMDVQDVSLGGFRTLSPVPLEPGTVHTFEVILPGLEATPLLMVGEVIHCRPAGSGASPCTIGWEWGNDLSTSRGVTRVLDHMTDARSFLKSQC